MEENNWLVNEAGMYNLILDSPKAEAKEFRRWVTDEVLPALSKTGSYSMHKHRDLMGKPLWQSFFEKMGYRIVETKEEDL